MKDFPVFPTQHGAASLILKEIPYRGEAYIQIQSTQEPDALLEECIHFCVACGAERVYAAGHDRLEAAYPLHTSIYRMTGTIQLHEEEIPAMFPATEQTAERWRECYNQRMKNVDNAATLESRDTPNIVQGNAYFIHRNGTLLGIGWIEGNKLRAIASMQPEAGEALCRAMQSLIPQQQMTLEVASTNQKAIALYERLGLIKVEELSRWYQVK